MRSQNACPALFFCWKTPCSPMHGRPLPLEWIYKWSEVSMSSSGRKKGQEADDLAELSCRLRESGALQSHADLPKPAGVLKQARQPPAPCWLRMPMLLASLGNPVLWRGVISDVKVFLMQEGSRQAPDSGPTAAAAAAAAAPRKEWVRKEKKKHKRKDGASANEKQAAPEQEEPHSDAAAVPHPTIDHLLGCLRQAAAEVRQAAAEQQVLAGALRRQLASLAKCVSQLTDALASKGYLQPPAALWLLQEQLAQAGAPSSSSSSMAPLQLAALALQADAATAAIEQLLAAAGQQQQQQGRQQQAQRQEQFQAWVMSTFADCYAAEVEALQDAEPPIPAGVLLQCVRMAAGSDAMFPAHHQALVLDTAVDGAHT